jgi:hypothetical protein
MPIPLIPAILGTLTGVFIFFKYGHNEPINDLGLNEWGERFDPATGTWSLPDLPEFGDSNIIDIDTPLGEINIDNKILLLPLLYIVLKTKPWK